MKFLVVEDHPIFRFGVRHLIRERWRDADIAEASSLAQALQQAHGGGCDLAILDLNLPDSQGMESVSRLRRAVPAMPMLVLSLHEEVAYARQAIQLGAQGYMAKENAPDELIAAIQTILGGGRYLSQSLAQSLAFSAIGEEAKPALESLGSQEYRVLLQLIEGARVSDIAATMNLSPKTVSTYRSRIFEKLGVSSNVELARYYRLHSGGKGGAD